MLFDFILQSRGGDKPELSDQEYIDYVLGHIVNSPEFSIHHGFVTTSGDVIGYTSESFGNIHYILSKIYCGNEVLNPLYSMDIDFNSIKIKSSKSFKTPTPICSLTEAQVSTWLQVLERTGNKMFNLGWGEDCWYSLSQITQMDIYTLNKHLTT